MENIAKDKRRHSINFTIVGLAVLIAPCSVGEPADNKLTPNELNVNQADDKPYELDRSIAFSK